MGSDRYRMREYILEQVKNIVLSEVEKTSTAVFLFGSWARGEERRTSDIDIGILHNSELTPEVFSKIRWALEESTVPYRVDVVDLDRADPILLEKVRKEGILLYGKVK